MKDEENCSNDEFLKMGFRIYVQKWHGYIFNQNQTRNPIFEVPSSENEWKAHFIFLESYEFVQKIRNTSQKQNRFYLCFFAILNTRKQLEKKYILRTDYIFVPLTNSETPEKNFLPVSLKHFNFYQKCTPFCL